jgi:hypothetical protein
VDEEEEGSGVFSVEVARVSGADGEVLAAAGESSVFFSLGGIAGIMWGAGKSRICDF